MAAAKPQSSDLADFASAFRRVVSSQGCDEIVRWAGAIMPEQHRINSGLGLARCAGMRAFSYIAALSLVGAILVASTSFTDRRSVKTWAPNTVVLKPKPLETAALVSPKHDAAAGTLKAEGASLAAPEQLSSAEAPAATRSSTTVTDPDPPARYRRRSRRKKSRRKLRQPFPTRFAIGDTRPASSQARRARAHRADPRSARPVLAGANPVPARRRKKLRARSDPSCRSAQ